MQRSVSTEKPVKGTKISTQYCVPQVRRNIRYLHTLSNKLHIRHIDYQFYKEAPQKTGVRPRATSATSALLLLKTLPFLRKCRVQACTSVKPRALFRTAVPH